MHQGRLNWTDWLLRVLTWEGLVPATVFFGSMAIAILSKHDFWLIIGTGILLPSIACVVRFRSGMRTIETNNCHPFTRFWQMKSLIIGVIIMGFMEGLYIIYSTKPGLGLLGGGNDTHIWIGFLLAYLLLLTFATYPGLSSNTLYDSDDFFEDDDCLSIPSDHLE